MFLLYHAYVYLEFLILACTIYILAPFFAMLNEEVSDDLVSNEGELNWFSLKQLDELEMPYTARYVMNHYCSIGQYSDKIYTGVAN